MKKFKFIKGRQKGGPGVSIKMIKKSANLQDLLDEFNFFIENGDLPRLWPKEINSCQGCHLCCHEPLPVSSIDVMNICRSLNIDLFAAFNYLSVDVQSAIVDITLKRKKGSCIFLNRQGLCDIYAFRPFLCQTYICCHTDPIFDEIRSRVANLGMDDLVRLSLSEFKEQGREMPVSRGSIRKVRLQDWPENCFSHKSSYRQVLLENVLSSALIDVLLV